MKVLHKIHLRADKANGVHTKFTVFMNGANCGQLWMKEKEAVFFHNALSHSNYLQNGEIVTSGIWEKQRKED